MPYEAIDTGGERGDNVAGVWAWYLGYLLMQISCIFSSISQSRIHHFHLLMNYCYTCPTLQLCGWTAQDRSDDQTKHSVFTMAQ